MLADAIGLFFILLIVWIVHILDGSLSGFGQIALSFLGIIGAILVYCVIGGILGGIFDFLGDSAPYRNMGRYTPANKKKYDNHWYGKK